MERIETLADSINIKKQSILIVGDDLATIDGFKSLLEQDYKLVFATRGKEALETASSQNPDLILVDEMAPEMDSYELSCWLKANPATRRIPVVFIACDDAQNDAQGFEAGAADYIVKPIYPTIVKARVRTLMELKRCRDLIDSLATRDALTGISNQREFDDLLTREWRRALRYQNPQSLVVLDIDCFRFYNEHYGRQCGDECLCAIAQAVTDSAKRETDYVARSGDDEFACLLPDTDAHGAMQVAQRIHETVQRLNIPHARSKITDHVTVSIGAATLTPALRLTQTHLTSHAETLLYEAKKSGGNQIKSWQG